MIEHSVSSAAQMHALFDLAQSALGFALVMGLIVYAVNRVR